MASIRHIFFDLDHTLWDFDRNSRETLSELYDEFQLEQFSSSIKRQYFIDRYLHHNDRYWSLYRANRIAKSRLRNARFEATLQDFGISDKSFSKRLGSAYIEQCPKKTALHPGAIELLTELRDDYSLHILTNGFEETQKVKLESSGLLDFFTHIITSEKAGAKKPSARMFHHAMTRTGASAEESFMIGDSLEIDVEGARNVGWHAVQFNPMEDSIPGVQIKTLLELKQELGKGGDDALSTG